MGKKTILISTLFAFFLVSCSQVALTNRRQIKIVPRSVMNTMGSQNYASFLTTNAAKVSSASNANVQQVRNVGRRISDAVITYLTNNKLADRAQGYQWEFNVVNSPEANAWCMPGGKVVFYTGILQIANSDASIAVVMGHEIAHAIAEHGNERISQQLIVQAAGTGVEVYTQQKPSAQNDLFKQMYGVGTNMGLLSYSRKQELEADKLGLVFMAMAGYDPAEAVAFWQKMAAASTASPPEFLSTHPSNANRIAKIQAYLPEAQKYYKR